MNSRKAAAAVGLVFPNQGHGFGGKKRENASRRNVDLWFKHFLGR